LISVVETFVDDVRPDRELRDNNNDVGKSESRKIENMAHACLTMIFVGLGLTIVFVEIAERGCMIKLNI
jgi:hypothetical protein